MGSCPSKINFIEKNFLNKGMAVVDEQVVQVDFEVYGRLQLRHQSEREKRKEIRKVEPNEQAKRRLNDDSERLIKTCTVG